MSDAVEAVCSYGDRQRLSVGLSAASEAQCIWALHSDYGSHCPCCVVFRSAMIQAPRSPMHPAPMF